MSYECSWTGELRFVNELTGSQLAELGKFLGADFREHPEWEEWVPREVNPDASIVHIVTCPKSI